MDNKKEQFSSIYEQYIEKIYRFVYLKVNSKEAAQDITSRTFLKGWEAYYRSDAIKNPGAFLYKIARNMVVDHYRKKDRTSIVPGEHIAHLADGTDIHQQAVLSSDLESVKSALGRIKKEYQDVIILHYLEDMPSEQISQILQKSPGAVRVMIHRGLKALQEELSQEA